MPRSPLDELLSRPADARPVALEGQWLEADPDGCWVAADPVSILEGSSDAFGELPAWLAHHSRKYPNGAAVGFFSSELARHFESVHLATDSSLPDLSFA